MPRKGTDPLITRLEPLRPRGLRVRMHLDAGEPFEVALEALERLRLGRGRPPAPQSPAPSPQRRCRREDPRSGPEPPLLPGPYPGRASPKAGGQGIPPRPHRSLPGPPPGAGAPGRRRRTPPPSSATACATGPGARSRLDPGAARRGVQPEVAAQVVDEVLDDEEVTESSLAQRVVEGWLSRQSAATLRALVSRDDAAASEKAYRRLRGYLARRGFGGQALAGAVAAARRLAAP